MGAVEESHGLANGRYERVHGQIGGIVRRSVIMSLPDHPTVVKVRARGIVPEQSKPLNADELRDLAFRCGADDAGLVDIGRPALDDQRDYIRQVFAPTRTLLSFVVTMNREPVRSPVRSVANQEFHAVYDCVNETARNIVRELERQGVQAANAVAAFPMEAHLPGRAWTVAHKPVAIAAGLGRMGIHRSVIHPKFGSFVLLGTVLIAAEATAYSRPLDYNPCLECRLCVAACPVGALKPDGYFDFLACYTHNYREFLGNFGDWIDAIVESKETKDYRRRVSDGETRSMWQSLSFKPGYKAAYCISVCPAGEDVIKPYLQDQADYQQRVLKPLTSKEEELYVLAGSDAENYASRRFPHKRLKRVGRQLRAATIQQSLMGLRLSFQRGRAKGLNATYHWTFTGKERVQATVRIAEGKIAVDNGHTGTPDVTVIADTATWLRILSRDYSILRAILLRKVAVKGPTSLMRAFGRCFV